MLGQLGERPLGGGGGGGGGGQTSQVIRTAGIYPNERGTRNEIIWGIL